jgi:transposase-like protein
MSRKAKYTVRQKVQACEDYLAGRKSATQIAKELSMPISGHKIIIRWANRYKINGYEIFVSNNHNSYYTKEFKLMVVQEYASGLGSIEALTNKYKIKSVATIKNWISKYNKQEELQDYIPAPEVYKMKSRKTTKEERIEMVKWCINNNNNYKKAASEFKCSYTQIYQWVKKYKEYGEDGLVDHRGKRKVEEDLSDEEKLKKENDRLNRKTKN